LEDFRDRNSRDLTDYQDLKQSITMSAREVRDRLSLEKTNLKALGQVNLMAPEEFLEVSERYDFLTGQLTDLRGAKEDLTEVTEEIRRETAVLFLKTYKEIREHFHETFRRLFGGGRAEIRLVDQDDPLNSGLEIYAQPPGKKLENISLLSGGERSLCGVALMFATFLVKPSPFCILDEIDAALDEANIQRFVNLLMEFGQNSQFVVITHNKKTVSGARTLLGVTMQESGVSKLITLRLDGREQEQKQENEKPVTADR
jgi:chromosome segregation protein